MVFGMSEGITMQCRQFHYELNLIQKLMKMLELHISTNPNFSTQHELLLAMREQFTLQHFKFLQLIFVLGLR